MISIILTLIYPQNLVIISPISLWKFSDQNTSTTSEFYLFAQHFQLALICTEIIRQAAHLQRYMIQNPGRKVYLGQVYAT